MSNYPPYQFQPYQGPYMPPQPYQPRMDMQQGAAPLMPPQQAQNQSAQGTVMGLSPASRPVTSREEAMGVAADFSGALMLFPDVTHDRVYIKRWDLNAGGPAFQEYAPVLRAPAEPERTAEPAPDAAWASLQDLQDLQDLVDNLQKEVDRLKKPTGKAATVKNDTEK